MHWNHNNHAAIHQSFIGNNEYAAAPQQPRKPTTNIVDNSDEFR